MSEKKHLEIACSPNTLNKAKIDREFANSIYKKLFESKIGDEVVFCTTQNFPQAPLETENLESPLEKSTDYHATEKCMWTDAATKQLLVLVKENMVKVGKSQKLSSKTKLWKYVGDQMRESGHYFTTIQVESKFRGMERQYKKVQLNNNKTGRNRMVCANESELDDILGKKKSINPDCTLDESGQYSPVSTSSRISPMEVEDKTARHRSRSACDILDNMRQDRKEHYKKMQEILQKSIEDSHKIEQRKLELLEKLISL